MMEKAFNKKEKFVCELTWGSVPIDKEWAIETGIFKQKMKEFEEGNFKDLWEKENGKVFRNAGALDRD